MSVSASTIPQVTIIFQNSVKVCRDMFRGVIRYEHMHGPWRLDVIEGRPGEQKFFRARRGTGKFGVIAFPQDRYSLEASVAAGVPTVVIDPQPEWFETRRSDSKYCVVLCRPEPVARMAAEHLMEKGFRRFAYVGDIQDLEWSVRRGEAFRDVLAGHGFSCHLYPSLSEVEKDDWSIESRRLTRWLRRLPKPVGLLAGRDIRARQILNICLDSGILVPNEIAVLGVDNDELLCDSTYPPLSSILLDTERSGELAAELLDKLMEERIPQGSIVHYGPRELVPRHSTDALQVTDKIVLEGLEFIRINARRGINVGDVIRYLGVSRRLVELRFNRLLGRSVKEEIHRVRFRYVEQMLRETELSVAEIAELSGFQNESYLGKVFRKRNRMSMSEYRKKNADK